MNVPGILTRPAAQAIRRPMLPRGTSSLLKHVALITAGGIVAYPFYFMVSTGLKDFFEAITAPPTFFPTQGIHFENWLEAWNKVNWTRYFANTILVASKGAEPVHVACVLLATTSLDVNTVVRREMGVRKASFARADPVRELTGMEIGGVTPFGLPAGVAVLVDARVMEPDWIVLGGGNRSSKLRLSPAVMSRRSTPSFSMRPVKPKPFMMTPIEPTMLALPT